MAVREYIGARYVPVFSDPIQWDNTNSYEPLTVVMNEGTSYVSKQSVPAGIAIANETYWLRWADYNAQLEEYIRQVQTYTGEVDDINDALPIADFSSANTVSARFTALENALPLKDFGSENTVAARLETIEGKFPIDVSDVKSNVVYRPFDPMYYGADNTGTEDSSDAIDACIAANFGKTVVFTPGIYKVSRPIKTPYTSANRVSIDFNGSTVIYEGTENAIAILYIGGLEDDITGLLDRGSTSTDKNYFNNFSFVSNSLCQNAIYVRSHYMLACIDNFAIKTNTNGIKIGDVSEGAHPSDLLMSNGIIWAYSSPDGSIGVNIQNTDNKFNTVRVYSFPIAFNVKSGGNTFNTIHILGISNNSLNGISFVVQSGFNTFNEIYNDTVATAFKFTSATFGQQITNFTDYSYNSGLADRTFIHLDGASDFPAISVVNAHIHVENNYTGFKTTNMSGTPINLPERITFNNVTFNKDVTLIISDNDYIRSASNLKVNSYYPPSSGTWGLVGTMIFTDQYKGGDLIYQRGDRFGAFTISRASGSNFTVAKHTYQGSAVNFGISVDSASLIQNAVSVKVYINQPDSSSTPFSLITDFCSQLGCIFLPKYLVGARAAISGTPSITTS